MGLFEEDAAGRVTLVLRDSETPPIPLVQHMTNNVNRPSTTHLPRRQCSKGMTLPGILPFRIVNLCHGTMR